MYVWYKPSSKQDICLNHAYLHIFIPWLPKPMLQEFQKYKSLESYLVISILFTKYLFTNIHIEH